MKLTQIFIIVFLILAASQIYAKEGLYLEFGASIHSMLEDAPEVTLENPMGNFGFGYNIKLSDDEYIDMYFKHTSGLFAIEQGYGLNQVGIQYRVYKK